MERTGESYVTARRHVVADTPSIPTTTLPAHRPGLNPGTTALRSLLTHAGVMSPDGTPLSEAAALLIGGGLGMGVFHFRYEEDDTSTLFLAGRHLWHDEHAFVAEACARLGLETVVTETTSASKSADQLRQAIATHGPTMVWVDMTHLPYRGMPSSWSGGGYHVIVVHIVDEEAETALVSDLADDPIELSLRDLAVARARIRKFKHRILNVVPSPVAGDRIEKAIGAALRAGTDALLEGRTKNFTLDGLDILARRMRATHGTDNWEHVFPRGRHLWTALKWLYDCIEHYGTGGGLCRPTAATGFREVGGWLGSGDWQPLADRYDELGRAWSELANDALPESVPAFADVRRLLQIKAERFLSDGADGAQSFEDLWARLEAMTSGTADAFPLDDRECAQLRERLADRVDHIAALEREAVEDLRGMLSAASESP
jgi:hypothetical protein